MTRRLASRKLHRCFPACDHASQAMESQLLKIIKAHRPILNSVRYLPTDLLQEVFLHHAGNPGFNVAIVQCPGALATFPNVLEKICLISHLFGIAYPKSYFYSQNQNDPIFVLWSALLNDLARLLLSNKFDVSGPLPSPRKVPMSPIIEEILLHSERIERLRIKVR